MTAAQVWALPAGARAAQLVREGGACLVQGRRYDVELSDGRTFLGCGLEGDPEPARAVGRCLALVLCSIPGSQYSLTSTSSIASCRLTSDASRGSLVR